MVDLQALNLSDIATNDDELRLGAMATLHDLATDHQLPSGVAEAARAELPSTLRTLATVGGTVAARNADSVLLAALLVHEAAVEVVGPGGSTTITLPHLLSEGIPEGSLITAVRIAIGGESVRRSTARTPADQPIVSAIARQTRDGIILVAVTGVADHPVLVDPENPTVGLNPSGDFRGSRDYRCRLAEVLTARAVAAVGGTT
jgi:putative selenate reductase FAD-binding subunit